MAQRQSTKNKSAGEKQSSSKTTKKVARKRKTVTKTTPKRRATSKRKPASAPARKKPAAKKSPNSRALGRPRVAGTAELELMFRKDWEAREIFEFLGVKTLKDLEMFSPDEIVERLTAPMVRTVGRIRKALAMNNRCLAGDHKFALAFKKQLP